MAKLTEGHKRNPWLFKAGAEWRGNTKGRPKTAVMLPPIVRRKTRDGQEIIDFYLEVMRDETKDIEARLRAAARLEDRGWGKSPQVAEITERTERSLVLVIQRPGDALPTNDRIRQLFDPSTPAPPLDVSPVMADDNGNPDDPGD